MPKLAKYTLAWSAEHNSYEVRDSAQASLVAASDGDAWARWLDEHGSFSFKGRNGQLTLLKEGRKGGAGYWYAYRRQGEHTTKRYAGRSGELTFARLEGLAQAILGSTFEDQGSEDQDSEDQSGQALVPQLQTGMMAHECGASFAAQGPLLTPKLLPPRLHSSLIRRQRLLAQLDAGREGKLTLVSAPAGFGKTTMVRQWLAEVEQQGAPPTVAWLSLDHGDNDPLRFWRYLISACCAFGPEVGSQSLALLEAPMSIRPPLEMSLAAFVNELAQVKGEGILVLEEYHLITTSLIHEAVTFLLDHLPPGLHLLLITRTNPPLPLARLRAAGELTEIEAPELRFSEAETAAFLRQASALALPAGEIAQVERHIEGWAAGLRLLAVALEGRQDAGEISLILANFVAGRRGIGDYFISEVLNHQPPPLQLFLLQTSFLGSLTASLCDSVIGDNNSPAMLEMLDQANLFLEPLDGSGLWYRYHALFAAAMQGEAKRRLGEAAVRELLERAGRWYEEHAMLDEAIEATLAAQNQRGAADLIEIVVGRQFSFERPTMHFTPEFYTLQRWLSQLPEALMAERPLLNLALATAMLFTYLMDMQPPPGIVGGEIEHLLLRAERGFNASGERGRLGQVFGFRALVARERGESAAAVGWAKAALDLLPPQEMAWRNVSVGTLGLGEASAGHLDSAALHFAEARAMCEALGNRTFARAHAGMLSWVFVEQNDLPRAAALMHQMLAEARTMNDLDDIGHNLQGLAEVALCWNELDKAWAQAAEVVESTHHHTHEQYHIYAVLILARIEQARGQSEDALARCAALLASREPALLPAEKQINAQIEFEQARIALAAGDLTSVHQWRATRPTGLEIMRTDQERVEILLARLLMAEGNPGAAAQLLEALLAAAEAGGRGRVALEMRVALALANVACGQPQQARQTVATAIANARPANAQRVFVAEGEAIAALLRATLPALDDKSLVAFAKTILAAITGSIPGVSPTAVPPSADALSQQERRVLRLIAAGRSNADIASDLIVSVNTVKSHVKNIYRKLNVGNRLAAIDAARTLSLL